MSSKENLDFIQEALNYHSLEPKGKVQVVPTKPTSNAKDLSLAYSPGVAYPCLEIQRNDDLSYEYTNRGNLVAIITNGTAVLGLGDIGASAGKPVMEGKAVLFKKFAGIDVFDLEVGTKDSDEFIRCVKLLEPGFGGVNLEDIKAPECFYIEEKLIELMDIPVFHDDQHGTAIVALAAIINSLELANKRAEDVKLVISGAGAAAISIARLVQEIKIKKENIFLVDSKGVLHERRTDLNSIKEEFRIKTSANTLEDAMVDADIFVGVSNKDLVSQEMVKKMARNPILFALANPDPEIPYPKVIEARKDAIMGTGRSDFPNQVNNVLGFPYIFRGALDTKSRKINFQMKLAAAFALAKLAKEDVPEYVSKAYNGQKFSFGKEYVIPKPFDPRAYYIVSTAVAKAAYDTGVARIKSFDADEYLKKLERLRPEL